MVQEFIFQSLKKHPQLEPRSHSADPQGLLNARPARTEPAVARLLTLNPLKITNGSPVTVFEENHGRSTSDTLDLEMERVETVFQTQILIILLDLQLQKLMIIIIHLQLVAQPRLQLV